MALPLVLLWLLVVTHGIAFGAGLYEHRVVLPQWFIREEGRLRVDADTMRDMDVGRRFWGFVTTAPLTLLALANGFAVAQADGPARPWWIAAVVLTCVERAGTFAYFIPTAIRLAAPETEDAARTAMAGTWMLLNRLRLALAAAAWLTALEALIRAR